MDGPSYTRDMKRLAWALAFAVFLFGLVAFAFGTLV